MTPAPESGRVRVSHGNRGVLEARDGAHVDCAWRRSVGRPVCGDFVHFERQQDGSGALTGIEPRRNVFARADARLRPQVIAANLDVVLVVIAPRPEPSRDLVERYLVAVQGMGIEPVLVLNKAELLEAAGHAADSPLARLDGYTALGYPVVRTSCKGAPGIDGLRPLLQERTAILVGQSGVGKSSLVNVLLPDLELQTGDLSRVTGKGTHTTTTTIMYRLPGGGRLIDSPGVWEYGLWTMSREELVAGFPEFHPHDATCRFNDCSHRVEPGCGVRRAVEEGRIPAWRHAAYLRLLEQSEA